MIVFFVPGGHKSCAKVHASKLISICSTFTIQSITLVLFSYAMISNKHDSNSLFILHLGYHYEYYGSKEGYKEYLNQSD